MVRKLLIKLDYEAGSGLLPLCSDLIASVVSTGDSSEFKASREALSSFGMSCFFNHASISPLALNSYNSW